MTSEICTITCSRRGHSSSVLLWLLGILAVTQVSACVEEPQQFVLFDYAYDDGPWLTWTEAPTSSVTVNWLTRNPSPTTLEFGPTPSAMVSQTPEPRPTHLHRARFDGLEPDSEYCYVLPDTFLGPERGPFCFRTAPALHRHLRIGVVGDMQPDHPDLRVTNRYMAEQLAAVDVDAWVQVGDAVQSGGDLERWHDLFASLPAFAATTPLLATIGNHDLEGDDGRNWRALFPHPFVRTDSHYYSVDVLDVHLVMLDNFDGEDGPSEAQLLWLEQDLANARAAGQWIFAFMHLSILSTGTENMQPVQQAAFSPLFARYRVDGVFYGHDHMYEHFAYIYGDDGLVHNPDDADLSGRLVHYWMTGGGGAALEDTYGLLTRPTQVTTQSWYRLGDETQVETTSSRRPWSAARHRDANPLFAPNGRNYVHDCDVECYQDDAVRFGHDYGENTLNYIVLEIADGTATVTAHYPDGSIVGEDQGKPQRFELVH